MCFLGRTSTLNSILFVHSHQTFCVTYCEYRLSHFIPMVCCRRTIYCKCQSLESVLTINTLPWDLRTIWKKKFMWTIPAWISNCLSQDTVGCKYLSLPGYLLLAPKSSYDPTRFSNHFPLYCVVCAAIHDDVIKWKYFPHYWPFVQGIHRSPVNSPHKGQWRGVFMFFFFICAWINAWVSNREAGDLRRSRAHYDVIVMYP